MITFEKTLERDTLLATQCLFSRAMIDELPREIAIPGSERPMTILHKTSDNVEIWENKRSLENLHDRLLSVNKHGTRFVNDRIRSYTPVQEKLEKYFQGGSLTLRSSLQDFFSLAQRGMAVAAICFYTSTDSRTSSELLEIVSEFRRRDEIFAKSDSFIRKSVAGFGDDMDSAAFAMPEELLHPPNKDLLRARMCTGVVVVNGRNLSESNLENFAKIYPEYVFESGKRLKNVGSVAGAVAYKGIVRGVVRIVRNKKQNSEVCIGEIIVSPMTTPDFVASMRRAAAFVTDEGGIACHAAIIARELKKPCIIGTRIATQVLKDGDLVEVDANEGIVRVIKKA